MKKLKSLTILFTLILIGFFVTGNFVFASNTNGTIDTTYKYAWGENTGWINFGASNSGVTITDSKLTGYALSENFGWINLDNITNDSEGNLSGLAWSENTGWIKFNPTNGGVVINPEGYFTGSALSENTGWIIFGGDYKVRTDWRPESVRPRHSSGGSFIGFFSSIFNTEPSTPTPESNTEKTIVDDIISAIKETPKKIVDNIIPDFLKPQAPEIKIPQITSEELATRESPLVFKGNWDLLSRESMQIFVLAPLPKDILKLAEKFPELGDTLRKVGINKITDVEKLLNADLILPGLTQSSGLPSTELASGKLVLPDGVPLAKLSVEAKRQIPSEIIFAKTGGGLVDFDMALSINDQGQAQQKITTIAGKPLELVVKPDSPVKSIKGYVVLKSTNTQSSSSLSLRNILSSSLFASPVLAYPQQKPVKVENKLVLYEFEYTDPDKDGLYTANIESSLVEGEYEIITVMEFEDPTMGKREIRLITVVDPEGYVYTNSTLGKVRIAETTVSIYTLNTKTKEYELWNADEYQQKNPQITDDTGKYSFLVPPGKYYIKAEHANYNPYKSEIFEVKEGTGVHMNIELKSTLGWFRNLDWKILLIIIFGILLLYVFYRDKIREKLFKKILEDKLKITNKID